MVNVQWKGEFTKFRLQRKRERLANFVRRPIRVGLKSVLGLFSLSAFRCKHQEKLESCTILLPSYAIFDYVGG